MSLLRFLRNTKEHLISNAMDFCGHHPCFALINCVIGRDTAITILTTLHNKNHDKFIEICDTNIIPLFSLFKGLLYTITTLF